ncbi:MAG: bifunctional nuclease family protein [Acidimicrobiales bacterium]
MSDADAPDAPDAANPATSSAGDPVENEPSSPGTVFRVMTVESVTFDLADPSPQVHLMESEAPYRHLSVPIALPEAQALHAAMHNLTGRRPATHELVSAIIRQFQADIIAVRVTRYDAGVFYAELDVMTPRGREVFDARPSDAFILALRQAVAAPILCDEDVLGQFFVS